MTSIISFITSRFGALFSAALAVILAATSLGLAVDLYFTSASLHTTVATAAGYKATLDILSEDKKAADVRLASALVAVQPQIVHDREVTTRIIAAQPGPDKCASAHDLINDTLAQEKLP